VVGNALEQEIIELYVDNPSSLYSINQIAGKLGKTYPYINKKVTSFINNKILNKTIVGRSHLCSLNLKNDETLYLLILSEIKKKQKFPTSRKSIELTDYISKLAKTADASLALISCNKLILIPGNKESLETVEKGVLKQSLMGHELLITSKEQFLQMLKEDDRILSNHVIFTGFEAYYEMIRSIEDELRIKYSKLMPY
jgi:hypothetical protein